MISIAALFPYEATLLIDPTRRVGIKGSLWGCVRLKLATPERLRTMHPARSLRI